MLKLIRAACLHYNHPTSFRANVTGTIRGPTRMSTPDTANRSSSKARDDCQHYLRQSAREIFEAGVEAVLPSQMVKDALCFEGSRLCVNGQEYAVNKNVHIAAFGKAVAGMVRAAEDILGDEVVDGIASVPFGIQKTLIDLNKEALLPRSDSKVKMIEGAKDNLPDSDSLRAAEEISRLANKLTERDILLVMISGGGSALLPSPIPPITLAEKLNVINLLARRGATIEQLNTVRKNLSTLKGGRLATIARPTKVISLILSDIIRDPIDLIASGPTVPDCSTTQDCLKIFQEFSISRDEIPSAVLEVLELPANHSNSEPLSAFSHANNVIIGSNSIAVAAAKKKAEAIGFETVNISNAMDGEARHVAALFADLAKYVCERYTAGSTGGKAFAECFRVTKDKVQELEDTLEVAVQGNKPVCLISAGETTVTVKGKGKGGRNQELALAAGIAMKESSALQTYHKDGFHAALLSAGTDGQDGPTDAAGAIADLGLVTRACESGLDPARYLDNNDSYTFYRTFDQGCDLVVTGLTGTNVMDLQILLVYPPHYPL
nr:glycerate kinase-like [Lytechinus pictus]XP_054752243.1 glycerate kinase-like [Lytechinus pictus]